MKKVRRLLTSIVLFSLAFSLLAISQPEVLEKPEPALFEDLVRSAEKFVSLTSSGKWEEAILDFTAEMKAALPPEKLKESWESITSAFGKYKGSPYSTTKTAQGYRIVLVTMQFERADLDARVVFDDSDKIAGLNFVPSASWSQPDYADPSRFTEKDVTIGEGKWKLPGTLTLPTGKGPFPVVVLVHGSGPSDRDETIGPNKPFKDIAWGLATEGIAVLRYSKRTYQYPGELTSIEYPTVYDETIEDALAAVEACRGFENIQEERIYVLGHSLGGMLLPRIYRGDREISGLIGMAPPAGNLADQILMQVKYLAELDSVVTEEEKKDIEETENLVDRIKDPDLDPDTPEEELLGAPGSYWKDLNDYDQLKMAREIDAPMLLLQGERDYQVTLKDFQAWRSTLESEEDIKFITYPSLNHLFTPGEGKSSPSEYYLASNVSEKVIKDIALWIEQKR